MLPGDYTIGNSGSSLTPAAIAEWELPEPGIVRIKPDAGNPTAGWLWLRYSAGTLTVSGHPDAVLLFDGSDRNVGNNYPLRFYDNDSTFIFKDILLATIDAIQPFQTATNVTVDIERLMALGCWGTWTSITGAEIEDVHIRNMIMLNCYGWNADGAAGQSLRIDNASILGLVANLDCNDPDTETTLNNLIIAGSSFDGTITLNNTATNTANKLTVYGKPNVAAGVADVLSSTNEGYLDTANDVTVTEISDPFLTGPLLPTGMLGIIVDDTQNIEVFIDACNVADQYSLSGVALAADMTDPALGDATGGPSDSVRTTESDWQTMRTLVSNGHDVVVHTRHAANCQYLSAFWVVVGSNFDGSAATVEVDTDNEQLIFTITGGTQASFNFDYSSYVTIGDMCDAFDALYGPSGTEQDDFFRMQTATTRGYTEGDIKPGVTSNAKSFIEYCTPATLETVGATDITTVAQFDHDAALYFAEEWAACAADIKTNVYDVLGLNKNVKFVVYPGGQRDPDNLASNYLNDGGMILGRPSDVLTQHHPTTITGDSGFDRWQVNSIELDSLFDIGDTDTVIRQKVFALLEVVKCGTPYIIQAHDQDIAYWQKLFPLIVEAGLTITSPNDMADIISENCEFVSDRYAHSSFLEEYEAMLTPTWWRDKINYQAGWYDVTEKNTY